MLIVDTTPVLWYVSYPAFKCFELEIKIVVRQNRLMVHGVRAMHLYCHRTSIVEHDRRVHLHNLLLYIFLQRCRVCILSCPESTRYDRR